MSHVKGLVLLTRFEYLDHIKGDAALKELLKKISTPEANFVRQPVDGANYYPEEILGRVDEVLLTEHFANDVQKFGDLGVWTAQNQMQRYFNLYLEEGGPKKFLEQYARLRDALIGVGEMSISEISTEKVAITIDYGQTVPQSVCLSEQAFIIEGIRMCGAKKVQVTQLTSASDPNSLQSKFEVTFR